MDKDNKDEDYKDKQNDNDEKKIIEHFSKPSNILLFLAAMYSTRPKCRRN